MEHQNGDFFRFVLEQFPDAIRQSRPGVVDFVDQEDFLSGQLVGDLIDPLDFRRMVAMGMIQTIVGNADCINRAVDERLQNACGNEPAAADGDDQVRIITCRKQCLCQMLHQFVDGRVTDVVFLVFHGCGTGFSPPRHLQGGHP